MQNSYCSFANCLLNRKLDVKSDFPRIHKFLVMFSKESVSNFPPKSENFNQFVSFLPLRIEIAPDLKSILRLFDKYPRTPCFSELYFNIGYASVG